MSNYNCSYAEIRKDTFVNGKYSTSIRDNKLQKHKINIEAEKLSEMIRKRKPYKIY